VSSTADLSGVRTPLHRVLHHGSRLLAAVLALMPPLLYFAAARSTVESELDIEVRFIAGMVGEIAASNPTHWTFESIRIEQALARVVDETERESRLVVASDGEVLAAQGPRPPWPILRAEHAIVAHGHPVGSVVIVKSIVHILQDTLLIGLLSALTVGLAYMLLGRVPQRLLDSAMRQVTHLATHDVLTGLPNRSVFMDRLQLALATLRRDGGGAVALFCLDLDRFKEVNDTLGHGMGDELLREVAARLRQELRDTDTLVRLGGDEFAIIQPRLNHPHSAEMLAQRLIDVLEEPFDLGRHQVRVGVSVGIALAQGRGHPEAEILLSDADTALYAAKRDGRGAFRFFAEEMNIALRQRRAMEADLRQALARNEFELYYQPQVNLRTHALTGVEALLRWHHPERGFVTPDNFIPLAEEIGLLPQIGAWVLREACGNARRWAGMTIAVNVSAHQIHAGGFETLVARALAESGLPASCLEIEITEGVLLTQTDATIGTLEQIRALGVSIAMDDFGTGYSSLGYLQRFRFDKLKIDRSFIASLGTDPSASAIVDAVLGITRALGVRANAEGVETEEQARLLSERGCNEAQGWLFGRPVPAGQIDTLLAERVAPAA
jgi:diguanylate cyclase (GGDEF)-like protein